MINKLLGLIADSSLEDKKVGCFIETENRLIIGYNERIGKSKDSIIHAEEMALLELKSEESGNLYCSLSPCVHCAALIIHSGKINKVFYKEVYTKSNGIQLLIDNDTECIKL